MGRKKGRKIKGVLPKKKIKLLWYGDIATHTGFGRVTEEVLKHLDNTNDYDISVLGLNYRGDYHELQRKYKIWPVQDNDLWGQHKMMPLIKKEIKPDIVLTLNDVDCLNWYKDQRMKHIDNTRWIWYAPLDSAPNHPVALDCIRHCDRFITFTKWGKSMIEQQIPNSKVDVIPHGADTETFHKVNQPDSILSLKRQIFKHNNPYVVGFVGRNQYRKEIPRLLEAFKKFAENKENAFLYLHTCMIDNAPGYPLPQLIDHLGLADRVRFPSLEDGTPMSPGRGVTSETLNMYYNIMDVMALPSNAGGWELPLSEAMAAETPIITTNYAAMGEVASEGRAILVEPITTYWYVGTNLGKKGIIDIDGLAAALEAMYQDKNNGSKLAKEMIKKGKTFVNKYNWKYVAKEFDRVIKEEYSVPYHEKINNYSSSKKVKAGEIFT
jgi:glycosyltransferase involved in cell wall biosynthesis